MSSRSALIAIVTPWSRAIRAALALLAVGATLWTIAAPAAAAATCPRTTELAMESKVMCQVCGVPLALANSLEADRERALLSKLVARCDSVAQIEAAMVAQYGPGILASPGSHGFAITAWLVPVAAVLAAALAVGSAIALSRRRRGAEEGALAVAPATAAEEARLDAALTAFKAHR
jgi:cytochrome c-type biogenesis protein CcmH